MTRSVEEILVEAFEQRQLREKGYISKESTVAGETVTLYSIDRVRWFSRIADIARWKKAHDAEVEEVRRLLGHDTNLAVGSRD